MCIIALLCSATKASAQCAGAPCAGNCGSYRPAADTEFTSSDGFACNARTADETACLASVCAVQTRDNPPAAADCTCPACTTDHASQFCTAPGYPAAPWSFCVDGTTLVPDATIPDNGWWDSGMPCSMMQAQYNSQVDQGLYAADSNLLEGRTQAEMIADTRDTASRRAPACCVDADGAAYDPPAQCVTDPDRALLVDGLDNDDFGLMSRGCFMCLFRGAGVHSLDGTDETPEQQQAAWTVCSDDPWETPAPAPVAAAGAGMATASLAATAIAAAVAMH